ncbi:hypothetical protein L9F63_016685 [Diploptera punctata]|uniref:Ionotropic glutamate receptor C-terminal domain-containing protein n=1 Tax=Diploptera punctata TaxID=6984 RepID=A0AAD8A0N2_DIPPU|nr:hypothetical protein L9F63_016685 [Diploptera punctata]
MSRNTSYTLYCVWAVITSVSVPKMPQTTTRRVIFLMWVCYSLILSNIFQSFFTSFLIQPGSEKGITNIKQLLETDLVVYITVEVFTRILAVFSDTDLFNVTPKVKFNQTSIISKAIEKFCKREKSAIPAFDLDMKVNIKTYYQKGLYPCSFPHLTHSMKLLSFATHSPYSEAYNSKLMQYFQGGLFEHLYNVFNSSCTVPLHFLENFKRKVRVESGQNEEYFILNIQHLKFVFILFMCGNSISFVVFTLEIIYFKLKSKLNQ